VYVLVNNTNHEFIKKVIEKQVEFLVPGIQLAKAVYSGDNKILISEGTVVTQQIINKLLSWDISKVSVISEVAENPITNPKVQQFMNTYNKSVTVVQKAFDRIRETQEIELATFAETAEAITENVASAGNIIDQLYNFPKCDDYTFHHSVNVSAIAALIALWLNYPPDSVSAISLSALLHDVGKSQLPPEILNKPFKLDAKDYELYKKHTEYGYDLASKIPGIAQSVLAGIRDHHEREDGSGYPSQLGRSHIHPYAKIVAIADLYDEALTINCDKPGKLSPYYSLEQLRNEIYRIDAKVCMTFLQNMNNYLSGNVVELNDSRTGRVVFINKEKPSLSMVQLSDGTVLDLSDTPDIRINCVLR
jgi:putative nucleotidyltransferase with HDIG domain